VAQRLVRVICKQCKEPAPPQDLEAMVASGVTEPPEVVYRGKGCRNCLGTGYRGRQGVFELMPISEDIRDLTIERASSGKIREVAVRQGMNSLRGDGWRLVADGRTTVEEVLRLTKDETMSAGAEALGMNM
jgi:type II secretory ATPase GspE/PulE/Tfp pilus assembly ATPase PilB-like protein